MISVVESLRQQIETCETTLQDLRQQLVEAEHNQKEQEKVLRPVAPLSNDPLDHDMNFGVSDDFRSEIFAILEYGHTAQGAVETEVPSSRWPLAKHEYKRYGRQLIMPEIGLRGLPA